MRTREDADDIWQARDCWGVQSTETYTRLHMAPLCQLARMQIRAHHHRCPIASANKWTTATGQMCTNRCTNAN